MVARRMVQRRCVPRPYDDELQDRCLNGREQPGQFRRRIEVTKRRRAPHTDLTEKENGHGAEDAP